MTKNAPPFIIFGVLAAFMLIGETFFIVDETKQALVMEFGRPVKTVRQAGLYFQTPILQQVEFFERRVLDVDPEPERVILATANSGFMATLRQEKDAAAEGAAPSQNSANDSGSPFIVDTFARYRITDPLKFRQRLTSEEAARLRISNEMESTTRDVLGRSTIEQLLSKERASLMEQIKKRVNVAVSDLGIEIVDVRINRADLTGNLRGDVQPHALGTRAARRRDTLDGREARLGDQVERRQGAHRAAGRGAAPGANPAR